MYVYIIKPHFKHVLNLYTLMYITIPIQRIANARVNVFKPRVITNSHR